MPDFAQLLKAVVDVNQADPAACSVLREALGDELGTWETLGIERFRSTAIEERRQHGDRDPESTLDSLLNGDLSKADKWSVPTALGPPPAHSLPVDQFPAALRTHVDSVAGATQTHSDVASARMPQFNLEGCSASHSSAAAVLIRTLPAPRIRGRRPRASLCLPCCLHTRTPCNGKGTLNAIRGGEPLHGPNKAPSRTAP